MKMLVLISIVLLLFVGSANAYNMQVSLTINNTGNTVYIPSIGEVNSSEIVAASYRNLKHYFIASYINNMLLALVPFGAEPISVSVGKSGLNHVIRIEQELTNSNIFLIFSRGGWTDVNKRMSLIESGKFLGEISPSFSFGLGLYHPIKIILQYANINIANNVIFQRGAHNIIIENNGTEHGKPSILIRRN